ncbi:MAG: ATP-grasp domain-containing protein [Proteobacteria bacterium]|nr:ATP-grasp domain-containing protein [Pseudomonadota bacterium]
MKIAVVYNWESQNVINLFGVPNREKYAADTIRGIVKALRAGGHQVIQFEADKDLVDRLEEFMPQVVKGERPGLVFNLSYGIQGQARYTHVPGILEMVGIPYVGSGPLAHSLALDKVVAKVLFKQAGLPTPDFVVVDAPGFALPDLEFPLIVKPKNEAVSFGIKICHDEDELRAAAQNIFDEFDQPVLVERYIEGREVNVGIIGNNPPETFEPAELIFGQGGPQIYTWEDKTRASGREIGVVCPAPLGPELTARTKEVAVGAFKALGCYDCARVDLRLDDRENLYILEINSLPSLGEHGSYVAAAAAAGLDFPALVNRLVEVASARYFGTPIPPSVTRSTADPAAYVFNYITSRRDQIEKQIEQWSAISTRTTDPVGKQMAVDRLDGRLRELGFTESADLTDHRSAWTWQSPAGLAGGTLLVAQIDVPLEGSMPFQGFRREPGWLVGEGIAAARAPWVMLDFALRAMKAAKRLSRLPLGVLCYADEGFECRYSAEYIRRAAAQAGRVLVLKPVFRDDRVVNQRRGMRKYQFSFRDAKPEVGPPKKRPELLRWVFNKLGDVLRMSPDEGRSAVYLGEVRTLANPVSPPYDVTASLIVSYGEEGAAQELEVAVRDLFDRSKISWHLELISDRPPMKRRSKNNQLVKAVGAVAADLEVALKAESSRWPSPAGLVPASTPVLCGLGPVARDLYTAQEAVQRISLVQRTLLLSRYLASQASEGKSRGGKR